MEQYNTIATHVVHVTFHVAICLTYIHVYSLICRSTQQSNQICTIKHITYIYLPHTIHTHTHQFLAAELGSSRSFVEKIRDDSSDIVDVIRRAYEVRTVHLMLVNSHAF